MGEGEKANNSHILSWVSTVAPDRGRDRFLLLIVAPLRVAIWAVMVNAVNRVRRTRSAKNTEKKKKRKKEGEGGGGQGSSSINR
jgi:hypothetical protein